MKLCFQSWGMKAGIKMLPFVSRRRWGGRERGGEKLKSLVLNLPWFNFLLRNNGNAFGQAGRWMTPDCRRKLWIVVNCNPDKYFSGDRTDMMERRRGSVRFSVRGTNSRARRSWERERPNYFWRDPVYSADLRCCAVKKFNAAYSVFILMFSLADDLKICKTHKTAPISDVMQLQLVLKVNQQLWYRWWNYHMIFSFRMSLLLQTKLYTCTFLVQKDILTTFLLNFTPLWHHRASASDSIDIDIDRHIGFWVYFKGFFSAKNYFSPIYCSLICWQKLWWHFLNLQREFLPIFIRSRCRN